MAERDSAELKSFTETGVYRLDEKGAIVFVDPVLIIDASYSRFRVSRSKYYCRSFSTSNNTNKRKRAKPSHALNEKEQAAENRHQQARGLLMDAHKAFVGDSVIQSFLPRVTKGHEGDESMGAMMAPKHNFVEIGRLWQAPLYQISVPRSLDVGTDSCCESNVFPLFGNFICNEIEDDVEAVFDENLYILPRRSCFHMSDLKQVRNLIPGSSDGGFNLIVIDPPWENGSARQKSVYPTLPNRNLLYLPIKELAHENGALVALWVTNKEKLRAFVEHDLFPAWGVQNYDLCYWLKVKPDGSLISDMDLFHHRPYECVLVGYINVHSSTVQPCRVIISIPGAYSRKPPLGKLLLDLIPGLKPAKCLELFAREMMTGCTSWGNEPLCFQDSQYFVKR